MINFRSALAAGTCLFAMLGCVNEKAELVFEKSGGMALTQNSPASTEGRPLAGSRATSSVATRYDSDQDLQDSLSPRDRDIVSDFYASYGASILDFRGPAQFKWLLANRYPMPEEILASMQLTDHELLNAYKNGDIQAGFFYLSRAAETRATEDVDDQTAQEMNAIADDFLGSGTPLAGYAYFNYQLKANRDIHAALAGLSIASDFGDRRASLEVLNQAAPLYQSDPRSIDPIKLLLAYRTAVIAIRSKNPALLSRDWPPFPPYRPPTY